MQNKRILHVLSQRPDSTGSGIYIQAMIKEARDKGYHNFLVAGIDPGHELDDGFIDAENCHFLQFESNEVSYKLPGMSDVMPYQSSKFCELSSFQLKEYKEAFSNVLKKAVTRFKPDIIHTHHLWIVTSLVRTLFPNIPIVTSSHGSDLRQFRNCEHLQGEIAIQCRKLDKIFALTAMQKEEISNLYAIDKARIAVTGAGYNDKLFFQDEKKSSDEIRLIYAGKLSNAKGVPWLLKTLAKIDSFDWHLDLVGGGSGEERKNCLKLAESLENNVTVNGAIPQSKLAELFRQSDIFILPSFYEGVPLVVLEAVASGCRVVVTDLPGVRELLEGSDYHEISLVQLPRLKNIDEPFEEDHEMFMLNLKSKIVFQMNRLKENRRNEQSQEIYKLLKIHTWKGIFKKLEKHYLDVLKERLDETNA